MSTHIAIDFGTARTKIARFDEKSQQPKLISLGREVPWAVPSLFYIPKEGEIFIGDDAQDAFSSDPAGVVRGLKMELHRSARVLRNKRRFERIELAAKLFKWIRTECERLVFHNEIVNSCTLTIPPGFGAFEVDCLKSAAKSAGFDSVDTIAEPVAAARAWLSASPSAKDFIVVCDIGGGTSDIALVQKQETGYFIYPDIPPLGIPRGGNDIDNSLLDQLDLDGIPQASFPGLLVRIRQAKERVTTFNETVKFKVASQEVIIHPDLLGRCCADFSNTIRDHVKRFGDKIQKDISVKLSDVPLLLVGGGRYIMGMVDSLKDIWPEVYGLGGMGKSYRAGCSYKIRTTAPIVSLDC